MPSSRRCPLWEVPATGGVEDLKTIKSLLNAHRGELREWHGWWQAVDAPLPEKHDKPGLWQDQFFPPHAADPGAVSTVLSKPASGGSGHLLRMAIVFGLADLFFDYGMAHSCAELYRVYRQLRIFAYTRMPTTPKSRAMRSYAGLWRRRAS